MTMMSTKSRRPYKLLWMVEDKKGGEGNDKSFWTKIGVAFENRDGSYSLELAAIPVSGRLHMRDPQPRDERGRRDERAGPTLAREQFAEAA